MRKRVGWLLLAGVCFGCSGLNAVPNDGGDEQAKPIVAPMRPATPNDDSLRLAAACLESGNDAGAVPHLQAYLASHPDHIVICVHLGELLLRLHKQAEARQQFEHYLRDAPSQGEAASRHGIHCHSRLAEIARDDGNAYEERLHRGIGLYLLARRVAGPAAKDGDPEAEPLLFKAARQLERAAKERPQEPRPHWYLYLVWSQLGQMHPAQANLQQTRLLAEQSELPVAEFLDMQAAR